MVRVTMLQAVRDGYQTLGGEVDLPAGKALAFTILGYARPVDATWAPPPAAIPEALTVGLQWLEAERQQRGLSDERFAMVPANARRLERLWALTSADSKGGDAA
jgi:hypothetical protein